MTFPNQFTPMTPALSEDLKIPFELWFLEMAPGFPTIRVSNAHASATIALHGAHVMDYIPRDQQPVLYTSPETHLREGKAIRGGIPICWPWFSAHPTNPALPSHGFARNRFWQLTHTKSTPEYTELIFELDTKSIEELGHDCSVTATIRVGAELEVSLTTTNLGENDFTVGGALHSYFQISNISSISVNGLDQTAFIDTLTDKTHTQTGSIQFDSEYDTIYTDTAAETIIHDPGFNRDIHITKKGSLTTVVWNPWIDKAKAMADLPDGDYTEFLCIEPTNALDDVYSLKTNESHTLSTCIRVEDLSL